jgi:hypothetical protein
VPLKFQAEEEKKETKVVGVGRREEENETRVHHVG